MNQHVSPSPAYSFLQRYLHWASALLIGLALYTGFNHGGRFPIIDLSRYLTHTSVGVIILGLMLWRLIIRRRSHAVGKNWQDRAAHFMHQMLYVLLLCQPLSAVAAKLLNGGQLKLLGGIIIDPLLPKGTLPPGWLMEFHEVTGTVLLWLIGAHIFAALWHAWILRDGIMARMAIS